MTLLKMPILPIEIDVNKDFLFKKILLKADSYEAIFEVFEGGGRKKKRDFFCDGEASENEKLFM